MSKRRSRLLSEQLEPRVVLSADPLTANGNVVLDFALMDSAASEVAVLRGEVFPQIDAVRGNVFFDENFNCVLDGSESGIKGRLVWADTNLNGIYDLGEPSDRTDQVGDYEITGLLANDATDLFIRVEETAGVDELGTDLAATSASVDGNDADLDQNPRPPSPQSADFDLSCVVDQADHDLWVSTFNSTTQLAADGSQNGIVDAADFTVWRTHLNQNQCATQEFWNLTNREYSGRDLHATFAGDARLEPTGSAATQWLVTEVPGGVTLFNTDTSGYLASDNWMAYTTPSVGADALWTIVYNTDGSISLQNSTNGRYLDGDGMSEGWDVDESASIGLDDGWFINQITPNRDRQVTGVVFSDHNRDGIRFQNGTVAEAGLENRTVYVDLNKNATREFGEPAATTDADGVYFIDNAPLGIHDVRVVPEGDWTATTNAIVEVDFASDMATADFGLHSASQSSLPLDGTFRLQNRATDRFLVAVAWAFQLGMTPFGTPDVCFDIAGERYGTQLESNVDHGILTGTGCQWGGTHFDFATDETGSKITAGWQFVLGVDTVEGVSISGYYGPHLTEDEWYWDLSLNSDGSISLQSTLSGEYLTAEGGPDFGIGTSAQLGANAGWFLSDV